LNGKRRLEHLPGKLAEPFASDLMQARKNLTLRELQTGRFSFVRRDLRWMGLARNGNGTNTHTDRRDNCEHRENGHARSSRRRNKPPKLLIQKLLVALIHDTRFCNLTATAGPAALSLTAMH
jgi:hypothetical protein